MKTTSERQSYEKAGRRAETLACWFLRFKGYRILERRFKTKQGEIDIIALKGKTVIMAEVKQRASAKNLHETVSFENSERIMNAAELFINKRHNELPRDYELRFDIIHVTGRWKLRHIQDAFRAY